MTRLLFVVFAITVVASCGEYKSIEDASCSAISQIYGTWDVRLKFDMGQPPSRTEMILSGDGNARLTGSFYESEFDAAKITAILGEYVMAAETSDVSNQYLHMARYKCQADEIEGQTWSKERDFLMTWTAVRKDG